MGATAFVAATFALPGAAIGSFLNVVVSRVPLHLPIGTTRSRCMTCATELAARDNIPIASYLVLRGRCRTCRSSIPWRYPAVEATTAALVAACGLVFGLTAGALVAAGFCVVLVALTAIDIERKMVPNRIVLPAAGFALVAQTVLHPSPRWALWALGASSFLLVAALAYPAGMGMGDVKFALLLGAMLGPLVVVAFMVGFLTALVPAAVLLARRVRPVGTVAVPLVPFLSLGAVCALFAGDRIITWYLGLFGL